MQGFLLKHNNIPKTKADVYSPIQKNEIRKPIVVKNTKFGEKDEATRTITIDGMVVRIIIFRPILKLKCKKNHKKKCEYNILWKIMEKKCE